MKYVARSQRAAESSREHLRRLRAPETRRSSHEHTSWHGSNFHTSAKFVSQRKLRQWFKRGKKSEAVPESRSRRLPSCLNPSERRTESVCPVVTWLQSLPWGQPCAQQQQQPHVSCCCRSLTAEQIKQLFSKAAGQRCCLLSFNDPYDTPSGERTPSCRQKLTFPCGSFQLQSCKEKIKLTLICTSLR